MNKLKLTEEKIKEIDQSELEEYFFTACKKNDLETVKYLLLSPELKKYNKNVKINTQESRGLVTACYGNAINVVKYLLTSPDLAEKANINADEADAIRMCCWNGHVELLDYLLTSPELSTKANIYINNTSVFQVAVNRGKMKVVEYLIFDYQIEFNADIQNFVKKEPQIQSMFEKRDVYNRLNEQLENKSEKRKMKI